MAQLKKVVKLTQAQYNILASGGTVGSYTGLSEDYIYLIQDTTQYLEQVSLSGGVLTIRVKQ